MTEEHVGKVVDGRYRLDRLVGEGANGAVYAATQLSVDRTVAVKLLHEGDDEQFARRFESEARAIGRLNHTNIITLHDFGYDDDLGVHYMATEYAEGETLAERMKEVMSTDLILDVALQIASAMHHAHGQGILHRDLKPENVILTRADGRVDVAKVLDFGLARMYDEDAGLREASESQIISLSSGQAVLEEASSSAGADDELPPDEVLVDEDEPETAVDELDAGDLLSEIDELADAPAAVDRSADGAPADLAVTGVDGIEPSDEALGDGEEPATAIMPDFEVPAPRGIERSADETRLGEEE